MPSKITDLTAGAGTPADDALVEVSVDPSGTPASRAFTIAELRDAFIPAVLQVQHQETEGSEGGATVAQTWTERSLNTEVINEIDGASFDTGTGIITLPAGDYEIESWSVFMRTRASQTRFRNLDDNDTVVVSNNIYVGVGSDGGTDICHLWGRFTIAAEKDFELQYFTQDAESFGLGYSLSLSQGEISVYANVIVKKLP